ncbi:MAG TPA: aa3-type cytochrome c oxidase subunit IV [Caulobacteraceae bacterium]|nr:aa3-type cytochrome c oxidase subunit IV [Caulobacteraceae bacterium]
MTTSAGELTSHARTYHGFMLGMKWACIHLGALITLLIMWFATPVGFLAALITAAIVYGVGIWAMNHGLAHSTENDTGRLAPGHSSEDVERGQI